MTQKMLAGAALVLMILGLVASPAVAHVTTDPDSAPQGGEITVRFRVPNEVTTANVVKVDVAFPTDHPLLGVLSEPVPGWTATMAQGTLNPPVSTDDGPVSQAVSQISWTAAGGGGTPPGQFQEFPVLVARLPTSTTQVVFKAVQTYSDGSVVRWIDPVVAGQPAPDHPTPILTLTAGDTGSTITGRATATATGPTHSSGAGNALGGVALGVVALVIGGLALVVAVVAVRRSPPTPGRAPE